MSGNSKLSDDALLLMMKQGSEKAFTEIYRRYWKKLFTTAANKVGDLAEGEDIVQQIFTTIWVRRAEIEIKTTLSAYLAVAVKYQVFKRIHKLSMMRDSSDEAAAEALLEITDDGTREWLEFREVSARIEILIAALPEKCRLVFKLSREEGYSQKKIAETLGITENTVESHIGKALRDIRAGLKIFFLTL